MTATLSAALTSIILAGDNSVAVLVAWVAATATVSAVRWSGSRAFLHQQRAEDHSCRCWTLFSVLGTLATSGLLSVGVAILFPASPAQQLFMEILIGALCAGAASVNAAHLPTVLAFILPSCLALAARMFMQGPASHRSALAVVLYAAALCLVALAAHRNGGDRIRLKLALDREHRKLVQTNAQLSEAMTQRRMAEATLYQAQKMEAIGHLTGGIAHDFNNLLQVMIGNLDLIQRAGADNPRILRYAKAGEQAAIRGADLTSSLLTFARRQTLEAQPVDVNALLRAFEPILLRTLGARVRFEIVLAPHLPLCLADPAHFQSAVLNLVINARDAMQEDGVVSVTTQVDTLEAADLTGNPDASPGRFVSVSVRDNGTGMSADIMARVFEPFFTTKDVGKGSGLGLSQVYGFARQSRGHVGLTSAPNEGTVATIWLPVFAVNPTVDDQDRSQKQRLDKAADTVSRETDRRHDDIPAFC